MSPDKARQIGNDLACLAASIAEIAEEIKGMYEDDDKEPAPPAPEPETKREQQPKPLSLVEVRAFLEQERSHCGDPGDSPEVRL